MKVSDLMIGNWVEFPSGPRKIIGLAYVPGRGICERFAASETLIPVPIKQLKPIPITPEILEKNGFTNQGYFSEFVVGNYRILSDGKNLAIIHGEHADLDIPIYYVHELQNALRLCRIEKEIEI